MILNDDRCLLLVSGGLVWITAYACFVEVRVDLSVRRNNNVRQSETSTATMKVGYAIAILAFSAIITYASGKYRIWVVCARVDVGVRVGIYIYTCTYIYIYIYKMYTTASLMFVRDIASLCICCMVFAFPPGRRTDRLGCVFSGVKDVKQFTYLIQ